MSKGERPLSEFEARLMIIGFVSIVFGAVMALIGWLFKLFGLVFSPWVVDVWLCGLVALPVIFGISAIYAVLERHQNGAP